MSRFGWRRLPKFTGTGFAQPNRNGAPVSSSTPGHQDRPDRVDMLQRIERHAAQHPGRLVAEEAGDVAVRGFVQGDREDHRHSHEHDGLERKIHITAAFYPKSGARIPARRTRRRSVRSGQSEPRRDRRRPGGRSRRFDREIDDGRRFGDARPGVDDADRSACSQALANRFRVVERRARRPAGSTSTTGSARRVRASSACTTGWSGTRNADRAALADAAAAAAPRACPAAGTCTRPGMPWRTMRNCQLSRRVKRPASARSRHTSVR